MPLRQYLLQDKRWAAHKRHNIRRETTSLVSPKVSILFHLTNREVWQLLITEHNRQTLLAQSSDYNDQKYISITLSKQELYVNIISKLGI